MASASVMKKDTAVQKKPWIAIVWFLLWGLFQAYAVAAVIAGTWTRPEAFPEEAYYALMYPDMFFIPLYFAAAILLFRGHYLGKILGLLTGGAVIYIMIYLLALSGLKGAINLSFDSAFLIADSIAVWQLVKMESGKAGK